MTVTKGWLRRSEKSWIARATSDLPVPDSPVIKTGSVVFITPWLMHRHEKLWDDPHAFVPDRFLPENRGAIDRFAYLPFGAGPRICIGASFSLQEAVIVLAHVVRAARLDLVEGHPVSPVLKVTLRPAGGLPMRMRLRERVAA